LFGDCGLDARVSDFSLDGGFFAFTSCLFGEELFGFEGGDTAGAYIQMLAMHISLLGKVTYLRW
jgi:hypothetical protein